MAMTSQYSDITSSSIFFDVVLFLLSSLVTGPSFMSISSLVLELWQFSFIRDWPEIRKSEIPPSEICPISGDWGEPRITNLARMFLMKCYWMLQNARVTAFTVSELLRENQQGLPPPPPFPPPPPPPPPLRLGLSYMSSISKPLKYIRYFIKKNTTNNIKMSDKKYAKKKISAQNAENKHVIKTFIKH